MTSNSKRIFNVSIEDLGNSNSLHLININKIDQQLEDYFNSVICDICEGNTSTDLKLVKLRLSNFFASKSKSTIETGAIAEFICHAYLKLIGFKQEFLYVNLEEGSIKKGFDGYYTKQGDSWIFESKSGLNTMKGISHSDKIKEAYTGLKNKLLGKGPNDPWMNAYHHASQIDVGTAELIRKELKKLSDDYINGTFKTIEDVNVIPGSTIFFETGWKQINVAQVKSEISNILKNLQCLSIDAICINKGARSEFINYINR